MEPHRATARPPFRVHGLPTPQAKPARLGGGRGGGVQAGVVVVRWDGQRSRPTALHHGEVHLRAAAAVQVPPALWVVDVEVREQPAVAVLNLAAQLDPHLGSQRGYGRKRLSGDEPRRSLFHLRRVDAYEPDRARPQVREQDHGVAVNYVEQLHRPTQLAVRPHVLPVRGANEKRQHRRERRDATETHRQPRADRHRRLMARTSNRCPASCSTRW